MKRFFYGFSGDFFKIKTIKNDKEKFKKTIVLRISSIVLCIITLNFGASYASIQIWRGFG